MFLFFSEIFLFFFRINNLITVFSSSFSGSSSLFVSLVSLVQSVSLEEGETLSKEYNIRFFETSAKQDQNVEKSKIVSSWMEDPTLVLLGDRWLWVRATPRARREEDAVRGLQQREMEELSVCERERERESWRWREQRDEGELKGVDSVLTSNA